MSQRRWLALSCYMTIACCAAAFDPSLVWACPDIDGLVDVNCDGKLVIAAFGDSITHGVGDSRRLGYPGRLKALLPNAVIRNLGNPGESTSRGRQRVSSLRSRFRDADYTIVLEGVNDYWGLERSASDTRSNLLSILSSTERGGAVGSLAKLTQVRRDFQIGWVREVNRAISPYTTIDFYALGTGIIGPDKLHPNGSGYQRMAQRAANEMRGISERHRPRDVDSDGLYDYEEAQYGTNKNIADSDADGLTDGSEVFVYSSGPLTLDSDGDGLSDGHEVNVLGSDPADPRPGAPSVESLQAIP